MKTLKKLSFLLAMLMALTCIVPFATFAEGTDDTTETPVIGYSANLVDKVDAATLATYTTMTALYDSGNGIGSAPMGSTNSMNYYTISSAEELIYFAKIVNGGNTSGAPFKFCTVYLTQDIDFANCAEAMIPIGKCDGSYLQLAQGKIFFGMFDGQGYSIKNMNITSDNRYVALFAATRGATIKNLIIDASCSITSTYSTDKSSVVAGVVGFASIRLDYYYETETLNDYAYSVRTIISNVKNEANVTGANSNYGGGILGTVGNQHIGETVLIENCTNAGNISTYDFTGGIMGAGSKAGSEPVASTETTKPTVAKGFGAIIRNCVNTGDVAVSNQMAGGIAVDFSSNNDQHCYIVNCVNTGRITAKGATAYAGGIICTLRYTTQAIVDCVNYGVCSATTAADGLCGFYPHQATEANNFTNSADKTIALEGHGIQLEPVDAEATAQDVRFVYGITEAGFAAYTEVGMKIVVKDADGEVVKDFPIEKCDYVYESLTGVAGGETIVYSTNPEKASGEYYLGDTSDYLFAVAIDGVPTGATYTYEVTPYCVVGGYTVYGATNTVDWAMGTNPEA